MPHSPQKMHVYPCMRTYATVQKLLCHGSNCERILSLAQASCRLSLPPALLLSRPTQSPDAVRSRNPSKSTLAHDVVAAVVLRKHPSIICVCAGLIQLVYGSHSRLGADLILHKIPFSPFFSQASLRVCVSLCRSVCLSVYLCYCESVCLSVCLSTCVRVCAYERERETLPSERR